MTNIVPTEVIVTNARAAGFSKDKKDKGIPHDVVATAIALAESNPPGNADSFNGKGRDLSYGLWQINMLGEMGPERRRLFGISKNEELYDPVVNAKAAYAIYKQQGWTAWSVYTSGRYLTKVKEASEAAGRALDITPETDPNNPTGGTIGDIKDALGAIGNVMSFVSDPENWKRVGLFVGGGVLLIVGIFMLADESGVGGAVGKAAMKVVPAGRVASKVMK